MAKDVKFNIRLTIDGKEQIVTAATNVKKFAEELEIACTESTKVRDMGGIDINEQEKRNASYYDY